MRSHTGRRLHRSLRDEGASTLVTVLVIMLVLTIGGLAAAALTTSTTGTLSQSAKYTAAEAIVDAGIADQTSNIERGVFAGCATTPGFWPENPDPIDPTAAPKQFAPGAEDPQAMYPVTSGGLNYYYRFSCSAGEAILEVAAPVGDDYSGAVTRRSVFSYDVQHDVLAPALITKKTLTTGVFSGITADDEEDMADLWVIPEDGGSGNFNCALGGTIDGSVYVANGIVTATAACNMRGSLVASGNIHLTAAVSTKGDLISQNGSISLIAGVNVKGSVYAKGDITIAAGATVDGDIVSAEGKVTFLGIATVGGSVKAKKNINAVLLVNVKGDAVSEEGTVSTFLATIRGERISNSGEPTPPVPELTYQPHWRGVSNADIDALYPKAAGTAPGSSPGGFNYEKWTGDCQASVPWLLGLGDLSSGHAMRKMASYTQPTVIDARHCTNGIKVSRALTGAIFPYKMSLKTDMMIVAKSFDWQGVRFSSGGGGTPHKLWFISPDENCGASNFGIPLHGAEIDATITPMLYTNCSANFTLLGLGRWNGSMAVNQFDGLPSFKYRASGFPGWNEVFDTATGNVTAWELTEERDLN
ncbi:hypothetical protein ACXR2T_03040 [Leucobacter sp. HY1910]